MKMQTLILTMLVIAIVEMGDKTQLMVMAMASKHKIKDMFYGVTLSILLLNLMAIGLGTALSNLIPLNLIHLLAGAAFLVFALWSVWENEENTKKDVCTFFGRIPIAFTIGLVFFMAELGDKTQLYIISISATNPEMASTIFWGATFGLVLADALGLMVGFLLCKNFPSHLIKWVSYSIFSCYGMVTLNQYLHYFWSGYEKGHMVFITLFFIGLTFGVEKIAQHKKAISITQYHSC
jgi:putative Ca2+/H+ antiporter (TMEM165/GDT1 family)